MNEEAARNQAQAQPIDAQPIDLSSAGASVGRRRLIKLGAGALPLSLTLASRPVHAFACNTTSAWGSVQVNNVASVQTNASNKALTIERWSLSEWVDNLTHSPLNTPWGVLTNAINTTQSFSDLDIGAAQLLGIPAGLTATDNLLNTLKGMTGAGLFQKYMLVALLNWKLLAGSVTGNIGACLSGPQLTDMLGGSYTVPSTGEEWTIANDKIVNYLLGNNIVAP